MAIRSKDWKPRVNYPLLRIARFSEHDLRTGVELHRIENTAVRIFGVAKTLVDVFRYRRVVGITIAVEGMRSALRQRKVKPADIAKRPIDAKIWKAMQPYLETLTLDG